MKVNRRYVLQILGAIPFLGWLDPVRRVAQCDAAIHYRLKGDGRSLFNLLRDYIRNGIHHTDLQRVLGPFILSGPGDHDYTLSAAPGYLDFPGTDLDGHYFIEYPMSYCFVRLEIKNGHLINHNPAWYNDYPDHFVVHADGTIKDISRPLDEGPLEDPPDSYNPEFDA